MSKRFFVLSFFFLTALVDPAMAQGSITWATGGYPKTGTGFAQQINVKGSVALDKGWSIVTDSLTLSTWQKGGKVVQKNAIARYNKDGQWPVDNMNKWIDQTYSATTAPAGSTFNVVVSVQVTDGTNTVTLITDPQQVVSGP